MPFDAILFDLDGTLTNSSGLLSEAVLAEFSARSVTLSLPMMDSWQARRGSWTELLDAHGLSRNEYAALEATAMARFDLSLRERSSWMPGAENLLAMLKAKGVPTAIVTNAYGKFFNALDRRFSLADSVSVVVTSEDMGGKLKPDPFGLLLAAARLNVPADGAAYIGDHSIDVVAALAAGMQPWIVGSAPVDDAVPDGSYRRFASLREAGDLILDHGKKA